MTTPAESRLPAEALFRKHRRHIGLYARVGKKLGVHPSHVSRVVSGERTNDRIRTEVLKELQRLEK